MKITVITILVDVAWGVGAAVTLLGLISAGFTIINFFSIRIFKQCKAWVYIVDYFIHRRKFRSWLKSDENKTSGGEELSDELQNSSIAPWKARHALEWAAGEAMTKADEYEVKAAFAMQAGLIKQRDVHKETEAAIRAIARTLCDLIPNSNQN